MCMYTPVIIFITGIIIGAGTVFLIMRIRLKDETERMKGHLSALSLDVLEKVSAQLNRQNRETLTQEREFSARELQNVTQMMEKMSVIVRELEKDRVSKFGELSAALGATHRDHEALAKLTRELHSVIYQKQSRGQWGERMAEDILRLAGFQEGVNYYRQQSLASSGNRPDFTFILPKGLILNMDVKFPLENYSRYVNAPDNEKQYHMTLFLSDVKKHIREISKREYAAAAEGTVDYVVIFIPSDLIYSAIFQEQPEILDDALRLKVILCSPSTLYAVLGVIRQAVDNYALEQSTGEMLKMMEIFLHEWQNFGEKMELLGKRLDAAQKEYTELAGTRAQKLEKPLREFRALLHKKD